MKGVPYFLFLMAIAFQYCKQEKRLPYIGNYTIVDNDTIFNQVPEWELINQDSMVFSSKSLEGKVYLSTFFFTGCPTICPKVMRNMIRLKDEFPEEKNLAYICFSLDFKRDSVRRIKDYYTKLGINHSSFHILQGRTASDIRNLVNDYMSIAVDDPETAGGINHSGWILLVDSNRRMRSYALGTDDKDVDRLMKDVRILLDER
ncbi:MAG: SCO family protein [Saprospiraceae bacterium]|nr:SCO family protein [Saprospiraceae bacterium]